jgi:DNA-binding MarR family transcriptional regulator
MAIMTPHEQLGLSIKRLQESVHWRLHSQLADIGISLVQWIALREIDRHPDSSQLRLAELTFNSAQGFGALLARMEQAELIDRENAGGRAFAVNLTPQGTQLLREGRKRVLAELARTFRDLTDKECKAMQTLIDKVQAAVDER